MLFIHGYGCDQNMWRHITPTFSDDYRIVQFDLVGSGKSDLSAYDREKYRTLEGHASDVLEICDELALRDVVVVGHSVSAIIALLACNRDPARFSSLVMIGPSPSYLNDADYQGGFSRKDIDELITFLEENYLGWSRQMAPVIMGVPDRPELGEELTNSFCRTDPEVSKHFGKVTFLSDHREDVKKSQISSLIMQCSNDIIAPLSVGTWLHQNMPHSELVVMRATGHCPHLSAPDETIATMKTFLREHGKTG